MILCETARQHCQTSRALRRSTEGIWLSEVTKRGLERGLRISRSRLAKSNRVDDGTEEDQEWWETDEKEVSNPSEESSKY